MDACELPGWVPLQRPTWWDVLSLVGAAFWVVGWALDLPLRALVGFFAGLTAAGLCVLFVSLCYYREVDGWSRERADGSR